MRVVICQCVVDAIGDWSRSAGGRPSSSVAFSVLEFLQLAASGLAALVDFLHSQRGLKVDCTFCTCPTTSLVSPFLAEWSCVRGADLIPATVTFKAQVKALIYLFELSPSEKICFSRRWMRFWLGDRARTAAGCVSRCESVRGSPLIDVTSNSILSSYPPLSRLLNDLNCRAEHFDSLPRRVEDL